jgi:hypothetical protein
VIYNVKALGPVPYEAPRAACAGAMPGMSGLDPYR